MKHIHPPVKNGNRNLILYILLGIIAIGFYLVSRYTPLHGDDFNYNFIFAPEYLKDVSPFWNYFSFYTDNFAGVGRFFPHLIVAFFTLITGKAIFNIFSTIGFVALSYLIATISTNDKNLKIALTVFSAAVIWFAIPGFFEAFLWMAGVCNYLFIAILVLLFYRSLISETRPTPSWWLLPLWFAFGFITGWTNEGFIIGLSGATGIYYLFLHPRNLNRRRLSMLSGLWLGTICLGLTPFNLSRFMNGHSGDRSPVQMIMQIGNSLLHLNDILISFILVAIILLTLFLKISSRQSVRRFLSDNLILVMSWGLSLVFVLLTGFENGNSRTPAEIYALTLLCIYISYNLSYRSIRLTGIATGTAMIASFIFILPACIDNFKVHEKVKHDIQGGNTLVVADEIKSNPFTSRYLYSMMGSMYAGPIPQAEYPARYYGGKPGTLIISRTIYDTLKNCPNDTFFVLDDDIGSLWIKADGRPDPQTVTLLIRPIATKELNLFERMVAPYLSRYTMTRFETDDFDSADILGHHWIVLRNYPYISDRIYDIELK